MKTLLGLVLALTVTYASAFASNPPATLPFLDLKPSDPNEPLDRIIEGEDARYFLEALLEFSQLQNPPKDPGRQSKVTEALLHEVFPKLTRVRLKGTRKDLQILALFESPFRVIFQNRKDVKRFALYGVEIPKFLRFRLSYQVPKIVLERIEDPNQTLALLVKIPVISDRVYLHRVVFDPIDGSTEAEAGVLGDHLRIIAKAEVYDRKFDGIDYWKTFLRNYSPFFFPIWTLQWRILFRPLF